MVRKDGDTMKECMKTNNPTEFRDADARFNEAMDAYEKSQGIIHGVDLSNGPDVTSESQIRATVKEENGVVWHLSKVVNTTCNVNLRSGTDMDAAVINRIHPSEEFMASATRNPDWYKVRLKDGTEGYAYSKFVAKVMPDEHT